MIDKIESKTERTDDGLKVAFTATVDPKYIESTRRWAEQEAKARRLFVMKR